MDFEAQAWLPPTKYGIYKIAGCLEVYGNPLFLPWNFLASGLVT